MAPKRPAPGSGPALLPSPVLNVALLVTALVYGFWLLVARGHVSWPPHDFLNSAYTVTCCLALVGPLVLLRREAGSGGLGNLVWMTGGLLVWIFDTVALFRGQPQGLSWATPIGATTMGLTILAVLLAGWRTHGGSRDWSWTNVTGWVLGLFWVGMGVATLIPVRALQAASR